MHMGEGPDHPIKCKSTCDPGILIHVLMIIVIDELVPQCLPKDQPDNSKKENQDNTDLDRTSGTGASAPRGWLPIPSSFQPRRISHQKKLEAQHMGVNREGKQVDDRSQPIVFSITEPIS